MRKMSPLEPAKLYELDDFFQIVFGRLYFADNVLKIFCKFHLADCVLHIVFSRLHLTDYTFCPALMKLALDLHVNFCLCVCVSVFPVFFSRRLIGSYTGFWQWFWQPTYPTRCSELGWAVPHSDFLAWLSSATLKNFISGVSSRILMR